MVVNPAPYGGVSSRFDAITIAMDSFGFSRGLFMSVLPHASGLCAGRCMSASRNLARILLPDLFVIDRSCGALV